MDDGAGKGRLTGLKPQEVDTGRDAIAVLVPSVPMDFVTAWVERPRRLKGTQAAAGDVKEIEADRAGSGQFQMKDPPTLHVADRVELERSVGARP